MLKADHIHRWQVYSTMDKFVYARCTVDRCPERKMDTQIERVLNHAEVVRAAGERKTPILKPVAVVTENHLLPDHGPLLIIETKPGITLDTGTKLYTKRGGRI